MSQIGQGSTRANQKKPKNIGPKRALGPNLGPWALLALGPIRLVGPGGRGRSPLDPAHQPEADAGRVEDMPEPSRVGV